MTDFDDIRPYNDAEVRPAINRIIADPEMINAVSNLRFPQLSKYVPWLLNPIIRTMLKRQLQNINTIDDIQALVYRYMKKMVADRVTNGVTVSGLDQLDPSQHYLFISNHRDIAMDPAFVNWSLFNSGMDTVRIAIGDNLLTKPFVSDLMRVNKSFIVKRSAGSIREKFKASKHLSSYIHHSITAEANSIWIAQREGRAKDGLDLTNSAIISMLSMSKPKALSLSQYIAELNIVPVAISYEWDPCDQMKANELYSLNQSGSYKKGEHEDISSIAAGIAGEKGHVNVAFGSVLRGDYSAADSVASEIDEQIWDNYVLHPSNHLAYQLLHGDAADLPVGAQQNSFDPEQYTTQLTQLKRRLYQIPKAQQDIFLAGYANPVVSKLKLLDVKSS